jgi:hypothetical protein
MASIIILTSVTTTDHRKVHLWITLAETIEEVWVAQIQTVIEGFMKWVELIKVDWVVVRIIKVDQAIFTQTIIIITTTITLITITIIMMVHLCHRVELTVFIQAQIPITIIILSAVMLIE